MSHLNGRDICGVHPIDRSKTKQEMDLLCSCVRGNDAGASLLLYICERNKMRPRLQATFCAGRALDGGEVAGLLTQACKLPLVNQTFTNLHGTQELQEGTMAGGPVGTMSKRCQGHTGCWMDRDYLSWVLASERPLDWELSRVGS